MDKLIIEARVNQYAMRNKNKNVPWLPVEIAADAAECFEAGASIVHFHGRDADGAPDNRFETCRDTVLAVRQSVWAVTYIGGGLTALMDKVLLAGGHIQIGLGDYPHVEEGCPTNAELIARVVERARALGRSVASPEDARTMLRLPVPGQPVPGNDRVSVGA